MADALAWEWVARVLYLTWTAGGSARSSRSPDDGGGAGGGPGARQRLLGGQLARHRGGSMKWEIIERWHTPFKSLR